jgi:hypothetical protein
MELMTENTAEKKIQKSVKLANRRKISDAADVVRLLENLKVKNVSFIGHAMGGRVGMYTALHRYTLQHITSHKKYKDGDLLSLRRLAGDR